MARPSPLTALQCSACGCYLSQYVWCQPTCSPRPVAPCTVSHRALPHTVSCLTASHRVLPHHHRSPTPQLKNELVACKKDNEDISARLSVAAQAASASADAARESQTHIDRATKDTAAARAEADDLRDQLQQQRHTLALRDALLSQAQETAAAAQTQAQEQRDEWRQREAAWRKERQQLQADLHTTQACAGDWRSQEVELRHRVKSLQKCMQEQAKSLTNSERQLQQVSVLWN